MTKSPLRILQVTLILTLIAFAQSAQIKEITLMLEVSRTLDKPKRDSFISYIPDDQDWNMRIKPLTKEPLTCFLNISLTFKESLLVKFVTKYKDKANPKDFLVYVSPGHPLAIFDFVVDHPDISTKLCNGNFSEVASLSSIKNAFKDWDFSEEILQSMMAAPISLSSLNIAEYWDSWYLKYKPLWSLGNFNFDFSDEVLDIDEKELNSNGNEKWLQEELIGETLLVLSEYYNFFFYKAQLPVIKERFETFPNHVNQFKSFLKNELHLFYMQVLEILKDPKRRAPILENRKENLQSFQDKLVPVLSNNLFMPLSIYKAAYSSRVMTKGFSYWKSKSVENLQTKLMEEIIPVDELWLNLTHNSEDIEKFLQTRTKTEFNNSIANLHKAISNHYLNLLKSILPRSEELQDKGMRHFNLFFKTLFSEYVHYSITGFNITHKKTRFIYKYMSELENNGYFELKEMFADGNLLMEKFLGNFYEFSQGASSKVVLPVCIGDLFKVQAGQQNVI